MADWKTIATRRFSNAVDEMRKIENTAAKRYDVDPEEAKKLLDSLEEAYLTVRGAYAPRIGNFEEKTPDSTDIKAESTEKSSESVGFTKKTGEKTPEYNIHPYGIRYFIQNIPREHFPAWAFHVANRLVGISTGDD